MKTRARNILLSILTIFAILAASTFNTAPVNAQDDAFEPYEWDLTELYPGLEAWEAERQRILQQIDNIEAFRGTLGNDADSLYAALRFVSDIYREVLRVYSYASMEQDEDLRVTNAQERNQLGEGLFASFNQATAWMDPELIAVGEERISQFSGRKRGAGPLCF